MAARCICLFVSCIELFSLKGFFVVDVIVPSTVRVAYVTLRFVIRVESVVDSIEISRYSARCMLRIGIRGDVDCMHGCSGCAHLLSCLGGLQSSKFLFEDVTASSGQRRRTAVLSPSD